MDIKERQKNYMKKYLELNPDKKNMIIQCPDCGLDYKYFNGSKHRKTIKHIKISEIKKTFNNDGLP